MEYLKKVLEAEGIPTQTFALDPNRANIVARLKGNGSKKPLLILAHTDVVPVQREKWPVDPFGAILKDGYVWGRGSTDDKPVLTSILMTMLLLKRTGAALDRDVIFLAESGEEADPAGVGINFMVGQHFKEIEAEFAITEGGGAVIENRARECGEHWHGREAAGAGCGWCRLERRGMGRCHGWIMRWCIWAARCRRWALGRRRCGMNDTTRTYFEKLAQMSPPEKAARYNALLNSATAGEADRYLLENEPRRYSMLHTSCGAHYVEGGRGAECDSV